MAQYTEEKTEALAISLMEAAQEYGLMGVAGRCPHELAHRAVRPGARIRQPRTVNNVSGGGRGENVAARQDFIAARQESADGTCGPLTSQDLQNRVHQVSLNSEMPL